MGLAKTPLLLFRIYFKAKKPVEVFMVTFEAIKIKICVIKETISLNFRQDLRRFLIGHLSSPKKTKGHEEGNSNSFPVIRRRQHKDFCPVLVFETI